MDLKSMGMVNGTGNNNLFAKAPGDKDRKIGHNNQNVLGRLILDQILGEVSKIVLEPQFQLQRIAEGDRH